MNDINDGLIHAVRLDGQGGGETLDWARIGRSGEGVEWLHLDRNSTAAQAWLRRESGLPTLAVDGLLAEETRPRCEAIGDGVLLILRGVNLNPGADPDDMVSLRIWIAGSRVISVRLRRLMAVQDLREAVAAGRGPCDLEGLVTALAARLIDRMGPTIGGIDDELDELEGEVVTAAPAGVRARLQRLRHKAVTLRRYIAPQREALSRLGVEAPGWLTAGGRARLREAVDAVIRYVESLDAARERAAVVQDELANALAERLNRRMYVLSVVAGVFLPLGFVTGLLGVNVAGIPGAETPWAFAGVAAMLAVFGVVEVWLFRRLGWL